MSLLGFDALGRWPIGTVPKQGATQFILPAVVGSLALAGIAGSFKASGPSAASTVALTGNASPWKVSEAATVGTSTLTAAATSLALFETSARGGHVFTGMPVVGLIGEAVTSAAFVAVSSQATSILSLAGSRGDLGLAGFGATLERDFVNWVSRPLGSNTWISEDLPGPNWSAANSQASSWDAVAAQSPAWSSAARPSGAWKVDSAQQISPPVSK
jgi:hypothetical protein